MYFDLKILSFSSVSVLLLSVLVAVFIFHIIKYHWNRRWLYYYASKFDGPFALPLIGNAHYFLGPLEDIFNKTLKLWDDNSEIFRMWLGNELYITNSCPQHIEIILNKCLTKSPVYEIFTGSEISDSLFVSPVNNWKKNRKLISPTFNSMIIKSFQEKFVEKSNIFVDSLKDKCRNEFDIFPIIWRTTFEMAIETLFDADKNLIGNVTEVRIPQAISQLTRIEEIFGQRIFKPWLHPTIFWELSPLYKESKILISQLKKFVYELIEKKRSHDINDEIKKLYFINHLINNESKLTEKELIEEIYFMLMASSETTAVTESFVFLMLAIIPDIQQKIYEELYTIFGDSERDATLEDLNRMDYLERVIKETERLFPTVPMIARFVDEDLKIDNYVYPKGSNIVIPTIHLHRNSKLWKDPLNFNPDRFLPEETERRHRCAYLPFSYGLRNCPGIQYGMMSMKTMLSTLVRHYRVVSCNYQNLEDIKMIFNIVLKTNKDFKVVLEKR